MDRQKILVLVALAALVAAGCGDGGSEGAGDATTTSRPTPTTSAPARAAADEPASSDDAFPNGLRDVRYCEVLLLRRVDGELEAEVWNTLGENDCPPEQWDAIDATAVAAERDAVVALKNGPRHWTLDTIVSDIRADAEETEIGGLGMFLAATVDLGPELPDQSPYVERSVVRETIFRFAAGSEVHELTDPDGRRYVMQSYAGTIDPTLTIDRLAGLGSVLALPEGWVFSSRVLDEDLDVLSIDGVATVIQDDLQNTYQRIDEAPDA